MQAHTKNVAVSKHSKMSESALKELWDINKVRL